MIEIRTARPDDADAIADAHVQGWRVGYRGVIPDAALDRDEFERERFDGWRTRMAERPVMPDQTLLVPVLDGRVVGFCHAGPEDVDNDAAPSGRGEIYGFYLHPDAWGSGAATQLMAASETWLAEHYADAVLWTLRDTPRSRRFYEKSGWTCGTGDDVLTAQWDSPPAPDLAPSTVTVVQYRRQWR